MPMTLVPLVVVAEQETSSSAYEILWRNRTNGQNILWQMTGAERAARHALPGIVDASWQVEGVADFDDDGHDEIFFRNQVSGENRIWNVVAHRRIASTSITSAPADFILLAAGDFDADQDIDLIWRNVRTGANRYWEMSGMARLSSQAMRSVLVDAGWNATHTGDFNHDGRNDLVWRNTTTGANVIWLMQGAEVSSRAALPTVDPTWSIAGVTDFNNDGFDDLLWRHAETGLNTIWLMNGATLNNRTTIPPLSVDWKPAELIDVNDDGSADIFWRNNLGENQVWLMQGTSRTTVLNLPGVDDSQWQLAAVGRLPVAVSAETFYADTLAATLSEACSSCHQAGSASTVLVIDEAGDLQDYLDQNSARVLLDKVSGETPHEGGEIFPNPGQNYRNLEEFLVLAGYPINTIIPQEPVGHPIFASPQSNPISLSPDGNRLYVVNTPADTVVVIDARTNDIISTIPVGIDPVGIAVRPDGKEVWVTNHVSDSVSIIDIVRESPTEHQVVATIQAFDEQTRSTRFDEPVGISFADNQKAYVALSSENRIAIIDVPARSVKGFLEIGAQDPRAVFVRDGRLYVIPFESGNQTELAGCFGVPDGDQCTFDLQEHVVDNNNVLSLFYDADIVRDRRVPDRDLFVFDTDTDQLIDTVETIGTLLYGITVDSTGRVYIAQTEARNDANGRAGTKKHTLKDLGNRAFLNQVATLNCGGNCSRPVMIDLEPLPPRNPDPEAALATPFALSISDDDALLIATAAGSNKLFTIDTMTDKVLGEVIVGQVPRGIALRSGTGGAAELAFVLNAVENTVSVVDLRFPSTPTLTASITLDDPTNPMMKSGRAAFNNARASSTGTFSCESCHPDGNTDQLLWVLGGPQCEIPGCRQIPPRVTMPTRGLRDTAPYHWDGVPGDPFGGINGQFPRSTVAPNCTDATSCIRNLLDGALASTMCDQSDCPTNDSGQSGLLSEKEREAMAVFLLNLPYPPARERPFDDQLTPLALQGFREFFHNNGVPSCGRVGCHEMPFWNSTNISGTGMDAPSFRGLPDRWLILPQGRINMWELVSVVGPAGNEIPFNASKGFDELSMWGLTFGTQANPSQNRIDSGFGPLGPWQMFLEGSMGHSGAFARQLTLNAQTAGPGRAQSEKLLIALEQAASNGTIRLQGEGLGGEQSPVSLAFLQGTYINIATQDKFTRSALFDQAVAGNLLITFTGRLGPNADLQPALWSPVDFPLVMHKFPRLPADNPVQLNGRHIFPGARVLLDGRFIQAEVSCRGAETLPNCYKDQIRINFGQVDTSQGMHLLQVQTPDGLLSNEFLIFMD